MDYWIGLSAGLVFGVLYANDARWLIAQARRMVAETLEWIARAVR